MRNLRIGLVPLVLAVLGCGTTGEIIRDDYVQADRATYDAVAPAYLNYVQADQSLGSDERARRERTIWTWRLRLEQAEKPVVVAPDASGE